MARTTSWMSACEAVDRKLSVQTVSLVTLEVVTVPMLLVPERRSVPLTLMPVLLPVASDSVSAASLLEVICTVSTDNPAVTASDRVASESMAVAMPFSM